ncbi:restriction endonuclease subunit S [Winogradskyella thalassocola]|uniref:Type I restriction enzyme, S subunit n=1 Tax=Winogradskyella thalassocola TaxID=262004 RepID=A0A1G8BA60_9FLAO|nr:restriction endonuclease subunit S [Winogradskyella thalassocola]SDH29913.1 type I restriction enzyme, S subunit [Winogradskyella thalassocola]
MRLNYKRLGDYIEPCNEKNDGNVIKKLQGISNRKYFQKAKTNTIGIDLSKYRVVRTGQFAFNRATTRNGDKISIALRHGKDCIVSPSYRIFKSKDENILNSEYLMMWFKRPDFDRYARFKSHGSAHEFFDWDEMQEVELPIPSIEKQRDIVAEYNTIVNRIKLNETLNQKLEETAQALYKNWFVDFEFPNAEGKPYKSSGGEMVYNEELDVEIPEGWEVPKLIEYTSLITKGTTPKRMYTQFNRDRIVYIKSQSIGKNHFINQLKINYVDSTTHNTELKRSIILEKDILFTITGAMVGDFAIADKEITPANTNQNVAIIRFKNNNIHPYYLYFLLMSNWHQEFLIENTQDAIKPNLNLKMIGDMRIILPIETVLELTYFMIKPIIEEKYYLHFQINKLVELQNLLLSKMSKTV